MVVVPATIFWMVVQLTCLVGGLQETKPSMEFSSKLWKYANKQKLKGPPDQIRLRLSELFGGLFQTKNLRQPIGRKNFIYAVLPSSLGRFG